MNTDLKATNGQSSNGIKSENKKLVINDLVESVDKSCYTITDDLNGHQHENGDLKSKKLDCFAIKKIVENAVHWSLVNGFVLVPKERKINDLMIVSYLPFTLFPTIFKRKHFDKAYHLQPHINELMYKLSKSEDILEKAFENLTQVDQFISSLWNVYKKALKEGYNQKIYLSVIRCDYMMHQTGLNDETIKQVEINTIAAGFGYVGTKMSLLHREIMKWTNNSHLLDKMPKNDGLINIAKGFAEAWRLYNVKNSVILFMVLDVEINIADQRHLEYAIINEEPQINIERCTFDELNKYGYLSQENVLYYKNKEVSIVYFRAGYDPSHYKSNMEWEVLLNIEKSKAIKCPSVGTFLAGMKKIQEFISHEENILQLCDNNKSLASDFMSVFAQFFKLDSIDNFQKAINNYQDYVLKPQREGGGNNYYNKDMKELLEKMLELENAKNNSSALSNSNTENNEILNKELYIVMELLKPSLSENFIISPKLQKSLSYSGLPLLKKEITNELGIFGVIVRNDTEVFVNNTCGYCLRSKPAEDNEAGVMCGSGALDSVIFYD